MIPVVVGRGGEVRPAHVGGVPDNLPAVCHAGVARDAQRHGLLPVVDRPHRAVGADQREVGERAPERARGAARVVYDLHVLDGLAGVRREVGVAQVPTGSVLIATEEVAALVVGAALCAGAVGELDDDTGFGDAVVLLPQVDAVAGADHVAGQWAAVAEG